ncbi:DUF2637 domain-containing protein [Kitasatospora sp. NPDC050543]|uniref:DUF2637 domain-containing protein n=1 Tax=Kitasatospora sp. NPDC050543 TaxID=3364054 RepID=UPI0037B710DC
MYDWTDGCPLSYGTAWYDAGPNPPQAAPGEQPGLCDERDVPGGLWSLFAPTEVLDPWNPGLFVPPPRAPSDEPARTAVGVGAALPLRPRRRPAPAAVSLTWPQVVGPLLGVLSAVTFTAVCLLGWLLSYDPLRGLAISRVPHGLSLFWPAIVIGPWLVGCLSVLRAALDGRRVVHSWVVVVLFTGIAIWLCSAGVARTMPDLVVAGLPPVTAVVSLHQLVRQLASGRGPRRAATPRRPSRHVSHRARR